MEEEQKAAVAAESHLTREEAMKAYVDLVEAKDPTFLFDEEAEGPSCSKEKPLSEMPKALLEQLEAGGIKMISQAEAEAAELNVFEAARRKWPGPPPAGRRLATDEMELTALHHAVDAEQLSRPSYRPRPIRMQSTQTGQPRSIMRSPSAPSSSSNFWLSRAPTGDQGRGWQRRRHAGQITWADETGAAAGVGLCFVLVLILCSVSDSRRSDPRVTIRGDDARRSRHGHTTLSSPPFLDFVRIQQRDPATRFQGFPSFLRTRPLIQRLHPMPHSPLVQGLIDRLIGHLIGHLIGRLIGRRAHHRHREACEWLPEERAHLAQAFDEALSTSGFCQLVGYESLLPEADISALRTASAAFFAAPSQAKERLRGRCGRLPGRGCRECGRIGGHAECTARPGGESQLACVPGGGQAVAVGCGRGGVPVARRGLLGHRTPWLQAFGSGSNAILQRGDGSHAAADDLVELALDLPEGYFTPPFSHPGTPCEGILPAAEEAETQAAEAKAVGWQRASAAVWCPHGLRRLHICSAPPEILLSRSCRQAASG